MPTRNRFYIIFSAILLVIILAFTVYRSHCKLFACQPATWATIYTIAQTQLTNAGSNYRIGIIHAKPAFRTKLVADGPFDIAISIDIVSTQPDRAQDGMYRELTLTFSDREQWISWQNQRAWTSVIPSLEAQQRLSRVRITPRDVYGLTWQAVQRELSSSIRLSDASMSLYTDYMQERFGIESAWAISYYDDVDYLTYWIDAQTGQVVHQTKERFREP